MGWLWDSLASAASASLWFLSPPPTPSFQARAERGTRAERNPSHPEARGQKESRHVIQRHSGRMRAATSSRGTPAERGPPRHARARGQRERAKSPRGQRAEGQPRHAEARGQKESLVILGPVGRERESLVNQKHAGSHVIQRPALCLVIQWPPSERERELRHSRASGQ